jgi:hypothetical protein
VVLVLYVGKKYLRASPDEAEPALGATSEAAESPV